MMFRLPENSIPTRIFYPCRQAKLPHVHIITPCHPLFPPPPLHTRKSSSLCSRKGVGNYVNLQIIVKFFPPGLILGIGPFLFCCIYKLQKHQYCTLFRGVSSSSCLIFTHIYPFQFIPYACLASLKYALSIAQLISTAKFYKTLKAAI